MSNGIRLTENQLKIIATGASAKVKASIAAALAGNHANQRKHSRQAPLDRQKTVTLGMVDIYCAVLVKIIWRVPDCRVRDFENQTHGAKPLQDAIAAALSFPSDNEADGIRFEYVQEKGQPETIIEVYQDEN